VTLHTVTAERLREVLRTALQADDVQVRDDSYLHAGHAGASEGRHFAVRVVSPAFAGLARVARHRLVYDAARPLIAEGIHALAIEEARTPTEAPR
jgi:BolA family transcriptional regulator, general stress-responsive regulator